MSWILGYIVLLILIFFILPPIANYYNKKWAQEDLLKKKKIEEQKLEQGAIELGEVNLEKNDIADETIVDSDNRNMVGMQINNETEEIMVKEKEKEEQRNRLSEEIMVSERKKAEERIQEINNINSYFKENEFEKEVHDIRAEVHRADEIIADNKELIDKFLLIGERKVYSIDEYGDELEDEVVLESELNYVLNKIVVRENLCESDFDMAVKHILHNLLTQRLFKYHTSNRAKHEQNPDIENMSGSEFEIYILQLLEKKGYAVSHNGQTGDQGADLIIEKDGRKIIIQAKCYSGSVGNSAVQQVISAVTYYNGDEGWVITNSRFTKSAAALAQKANITLIDGKRLTRIDDFLS